MFPALLPLARCTTALVSATLIVAVRKLGHDTTWLYGDGAQVLLELADSENKGPSGRCIDEHALFVQSLSLSDMKADCWTMDGKERYPFCTTEGDCANPQATCHPNVCVVDNNQVENPGCKSASICTATFI